MILHDLKNILVTPGGGAGTFLMEHMPKSTQGVGEHILKFLKSIWYFFIRKIIKFQKIFREGKLMNIFFWKKEGVGSSGKIFKSIMVLFLISFAEEVRILQK